MNQNRSQQAVTPFERRTSVARVATTGALTDGHTGFELGTFQEVVSFAEVMHQSGLFPDVKSAAQGVVKIMAGKELNIGPMTSLTKINVVEGKVSLSGDLIASIIKANPDWDYKVMEFSATMCRIRFSHRGEPQEPDITYSWEDATKAKLTGKFNYQQHPRNMLFFRAIALGAKLHCPHLLGSTSDVEESPTYEEGGEVVVTGPTPPTVEEAAQEAERRQRVTTTPRGNSPRYPTAPRPGQGRSYAEIFGGDPEPGAEGQVIEGVVEETEAEPVDGEQAEGDTSGLMPAKLSNAVRSLQEKYLPADGEEVPWNDDPRKRVAPGKAANDRLKVFDFDGRETLAAYALFHLAMTGEVVALADAGKVVSGRVLAAVQLMENADIESLKPVVAWYLSSRQGEPERPIEHGG